MEARKIIITGGATRIGAAIAKKLSGPNKELVLHFNKSKSKAENLKKKLEYYGAKVYLAKGDLSKEKDIIKIINNMPISILIDFLNLIAFEKLLPLSCGTNRNLFKAPIPSKVVTKANFNKNAFP